MGSAIKITNRTFTLSIHIVNMDFTTAQEKVKELGTKPSNDDLLVLYKYYKQATVGDCNTSRPGMLDLSGKYKWDAWNSIKGTEKEAAEKEYVDKVVALMA